MNVAIGLVNSCKLCSFRKEISGLNVLCLYCFEIVLDIQRYPVNMHIVDSEVPIIEIIEIRTMVSSIVCEG